MTRFRRHRAGWPLLITSKTLSFFHLKKTTPKSLFRNILPLSLTRSRFCRPFFKTVEWFQDFSDVPGGGGTLPSAPKCVHTVGTEKGGKRLSICKHTVGRDLPTKDQVARRMPSFVSGHPSTSLRAGLFSRAERMRNASGFSPCSAGQGLKPSPDTKRIFHRILQRRTGNPQRVGTDRLRPDRRPRRLF